MNITHLTIEDFKRLSAVEITPTDGKPVILTGDNGQGKSSILDAIFAALTGQELEESIRHGERRAKITLTLAGKEGTYIIEKVYTPGGKRLTITDADGKPVPKMQTFLDALIGQLAFDPLEFAGMKAKEQAEALREACGLDTSDLDEKHKEAYAARTEANRLSKAAGTLYDQAPNPAPGTPEQEVSASEAHDTLEALQKKAYLAKTAQQQTQHYRDQVERLEAELADAKNSLKHYEEKEAAIKAEAPTDEELEAAKQKLLQADSINAEVRKGREKSRLKADWKAKAKRAADLDAEIEAVAKEKAERLAKAKMPVEGMELDGDTVRMNGVPFSQLSTAEQIRISAFMAMAQNPTIKIILIREGALISRQNFQMLADMAKEKGYQLWVEKFQEEPAQDSLHIVDGAIAYQDGKPVMNLPEAPEEKPAKAKAKPEPQPEPQPPVDDQTMSLFGDDDIL
jgi:hypothetical protein